MRPPVTYYGGKQRMLHYLLALVPPHRTYVEAFAGGASLFWGKAPSKMEVLNDMNGNIANFYTIMKTRFEELRTKVECTLHDEYTHRQACQIYRKPEDHDELTRAWAFWTAANMSYAHEVGGSFQWSRNKKDSWHPPVKTHNKRNNFKKYTSRLEHTLIFNKDALKVIEKLDDPETFFYLDPPYVGANQGHYDGYKQEDFTAMIDQLASIKGKFLLSSYQNDYLTKVTNQQGWHTEAIEMRLGVVVGQKKTEVLTWNYDFNLPTQQSLF